MCGLVGIAAITGGLHSAAVSIAGEMTQTLSHRGPDAEGHWSDERVALGHRRLSILDLSDGGAQPMLSPDGRFVAAFNGEIYNYRELSRYLKQEGWRARGTSDTEVMLAAIESWGLDEFLKRADGMFAFALYDRQEARVSLVRDRFGEKPLVFGHHDGQLIFASELRAFSQVPGFDLGLDPEATSDFFRYSYIPGNATIYRCIRRVSPGSVLEVDLAGRNAPAERRYWHPQDHTRVGERRRDDLEERLLDLLSTSVQRRLVSDRPVGAFLSGGIDSSLVCALAADHASGALKTFTMGWEAAEYDEGQYAAEVASAIGSEHEEIRLGRADVVDAVHRLGSVMDEPFADSSQLAVLLVAAFAREHVVVALSGDGGDELFAGYNRHRWLLASQGMRSRFPSSVRGGVAAAARSAAPMLEWASRPIPVSRRPRLVADKVRKLANIVAESSMSDAYQSVLALDRTVGTRRPIPPQVEAAMESDDRASLLWAIRVADLTGQLPDDMLTKIDRATMSVSLESRAPFLQPDIASFALGLGPEQLLGPSGGKQILRRLLRTTLPSVDFDRSKTGFGVPLASILRGEMRAALGDAIATHEERNSPVSIEWAALVQKLDAGDDQPAAVLWSLLMFELWAATLSHTVSWR